jgi:hypothetical protein
MSNTQIIKIKVNATSHVAPKKHRGAVKVGVVRKDAQSYLLALAEANKVSA